jgi:hypothetical protein
MGVSYDVSRGAELLNRIKQNKRSNVPQSYRKEFVEETPQ